MHKYNVNIEIKTLTLPRVIPSMIFVSYLSDQASGQTEEYRATQPFINFDHKFEAKYYEGDENYITFSINARSAVGAVYRFGHSQVTIPIQSTSESKTKYITVQITADVGVFSLELAFSLGDDDQEDIKPEKNSSILTGIERYNEFITSLKSKPESTRSADDYWGEEGLWTLLRMFKQSDPSDQEIEEMQNILKFIPTKAEQIATHANIMRRVIKVMTMPEDIFLLEDGTMIDAADVPLNAKQKIPIAAAIIADTIKNSICDPTAFAAIDMEAFLNAICTMIADNIIFYRDSEGHSLYTLSTINFLLQFMHTFPYKYDGFTLFIQAIMENLVINIFEKYPLAIAKTIGAPQKFIDFVNLKKEIQTRYGIPKSIQEKFQRYIFDLMDFAVVNNFLLDEKITSINYDPIYKAFPEYGWPLTKSLQKMIQDADKYVSKKISKDNLHPTTRGLVFTSAMQRLVTAGIKKFKPRDLKKVEEAGSKPEQPDLDEWAHTFSVPQQEPGFNATLPSMNEVYSLIG